MSNVWMTWPTRPHTGARSWPWHIGHIQVTASIASAVHTWAGPVQLSTRHGPEGDTHGQHSHLILIVFVFSFSALAVRAQELQ